MSDSYLHHYYYYYYTDRFWAALICTTTTTTLTDFERLLFALLLLHWQILNGSYLHYFYYTYRFWTALICTTLHWWILSDSYLPYYYTLTDFERVFYLVFLFTLSNRFLFYFYFHYYYYTLSDFERVFHLHDNSQIVQHLLDLNKILERDIICTTIAEFCRTKIDFWTTFYLHCYLYI